MIEAIPEEAARQLVIGSHVVSEWEIIAFAVFIVVLAIGWGLGMVQHPNDPGP